MSEFAYITLWSVYLISTILGFLLLWSLTRWQGKWWFLSGLIRVLFLTLMLTPANLSTNPEFMAPAFVIGIFDLMQGYDQGAFEAAVNLGVAVFAVLVIYLIYSVILLIVHSRRKA